MKKFIGSSYRGGLGVRRFGGHRRFGGQVLDCESWYNPGEIGTAPYYATSLNSHHPVNFILRNKIVYGFCLGVEKKDDISGCAKGSGIFFYQVI